MKSNEWFSKVESGDFDLKNEEWGKPPGKLMDKELQALLEEYDGQKHEQLAKQWDVAQSTVARTFRDMRRVLKVWRYVPHEQTKKLKENWKPLEEFCQKGLKKYYFVLSSYYQGKMYVLWEAEGEHDNWRWSNGQIEHKAKSLHEEMSTPCLG